jgi:hypothetical protein
MISTAMCITINLLTGKACSFLNSEDKGKDTKLKTNQGRTAHYLCNW